MTGYRAVIIDKNNRTLMDKTFNPYDMSSFITDTQYISLLDNKIQEKIRICFEQINPNKPIDLISKSKTKSEYIILDSGTKTQFINETDLISKAIIQVLYTLRCLLFHGELDPTETNQPIYEYAYNILRVIIKELR